MAGPDNRRGFLRGLVKLPLIGGGVTLIGNPSGAAEPVSKALLDSYDAWLFYERWRLQDERHGPGKELGQHYGFTGLDGRPFDFIPMANGGACYHLGIDGPPPPSTRAAVVLSAVGCDWREDGR